MLEQHIYPILAGQTAKLQICGILWNITGVVMLDVQSLLHKLPFAARTDRRQHPAVYHKQRVTALKTFVKLSVILKKLRHLQVVPKLRRCTKDMAQPH